MVKSDIQHIILNSILCVIYLIMIIFFKSINLIGIILIVSIIILGSYFILNRKNYKYILKKLHYILYNILIIISVFPINSNLFAICFSTLIIILFLILYKNLDNFPFHPALLLIIFFTICFPQQYTNYFYINSNYNLFVNISFIVVGLLAGFFKRINVYTMLSFFVIILLFYYIIYNTFENVFILFNSRLIIGGIFLLSDSIMTPHYRISAIISGIIAGFFCGILHNIIISNNYIVYLIIITVSLINPYFDNLLIYLNTNLKLKLKSLASVPSDE